MPRNHLTITPTPFKSSRLAIPPSPFSPKYPVTPDQHPSPATRHPTFSSSAYQTQSSALTHLSAPPPQPLHWLWQCHICNRVYQLGVTRRCLDDGHFFCAGTTTVKRSRKSNKKIIRHKACASEFDYQGWKAWGTWRRNVREQMEVARLMMVDGDGEESEDDEDMLTSLAVPAVPSEGAWFSGVVGGAGRKPVAKKDCWAGCDYPSECRWGKQFGVQTPVISSPPSSTKATTRTTTAVPPSLVPGPQSQSDKSTTSPSSKSTTFDDILLDDQILPATTMTTTPKPLTATNQELQALPETTTGVPENPASPTKIVSMDDLLESAKRRKRRSSGAPPSPLSSHPPSPIEAPAPAVTEDTSGQLSPQVVSGGLQKAFDDFELDVRRGLEKAGSVMASFGASVGMKSSTSLVGLGQEKEREREEGMSVKGLRIYKRK